MRPFALDLRALALWRIVLGALVLLDIVLRYRDLQAFYGDQGVLSRASYFQQSWEYTGYHLFLATGTTGGLTVMFLLWGAAAFCLMVGFHARLAGVVTWYFVASIQLRNPLVLDGGDDLLRLLLFWTPFLPIAARWSWDAKANPKWAELPDEYRSVSTVALYVQYFVLYFFAAFLKKGEGWLVSGDALYMTLSIDQFSTSLGRALLQFPDSLRGMTWGALVWEYALAALLLWGAWSPRARGVFCLAALLFHLSIAAMLKLGIFMPIAIAGLSAFIPSGLFARLGRNSAKSGLSEETLKGYPPGYRLSLPLKLFAALIVLMIAVFNIHSIKHRHRIPAWAAPVMYLTFQQQHWHLFAPEPGLEDGWFVFEVEQEDGSVHDAWQNGPMVDGRPVSISSRFANHRWRRWLQNLVLEQFPDELGWRKATLDYSVRTWLKAHPEVKAVTFRLIWMKEINTPPGGKSTVEPVLLAEQSSPQSKGKRVIMSERSNL